MKILFTLVIFGAFITRLKSARGVSSLPSGVETPDITQFYTQNETIWTINTTIQFTEIICKVDLVNKTTANYADFTRMYFWKGNLTSNYLRGTFTTIPTFTNKSVYNAMMVGPPDGFVTSTEELVSVYANYTCGIFDVLGVEGFLFNRWTVAIQVQ
nr:uncharacterized protein LOC119167982 isoform X2 [Rhipicephalus microplus]